MKFITSLLIGIIAFAVPVNAKNFDHLVGNWSVQYQDDKLGTVTGHLHITKDGDVAGILFDKDGPFEGPNIKFRAFGTLDPGDIKFDGTKLVGTFHDRKDVHIDLELSEDGKTLKGMWRQKWPLEDHHEFAGYNKVGRKGSFEKWVDEERKYWRWLTGSETWTREIPVSSDVRARPSAGWEDRFNYDDINERCRHTASERDAHELTLEIRGQNLPLWGLGNESYGSGVAQIDASMREPDVIVNGANLIRDWPNGVLRIGVLMSCGLDSKARHLVTVPGRKTLLLNGGEISWELEIPGHPCSQSTRYQRPNVSLYETPSRRFSGFEARIFKELLALEDAYIRHVVACRSNWTFQSAIEWNNKREALVEEIIRQEQHFIWEFESFYNQDELDLLTKAYEDKHELRRQETEIEPRLYRMYMDLKSQAEDARKRYKVSTIETRTAVEKLVRKADRARELWHATARRKTALKGKELNFLKAAKQGRMDRSLEIAKSYYPAGSDGFVAHSKNDLLRMESKSGALKRLLGPEGIRILTDEGARRRHAIANRTQ